MTDARSRDVKPILLLAARRGFDDRVLRVLQEKLEGRGLTAVLAGEGARLIGERTLQLLPDLQLADAHIDDYAALVILPGFGVRAHLWGNRAAMQLVVGANLEHKPILSLGSATALVAQAELLVDRDVASDSDEETLAELEKHHANVVALSVVETENRVISATIDGLDEAVHLLCEDLGCQAHVVDVPAPPH